jgi:hypothetical protein
MGFPERRDMEGINMFNKANYGFQQEGIFL